MSNEMAKMHTDTKCNVNCSERSRSDNSHERAHSDEDECTHWCSYSNVGSVCRHHIDLLQNKNHVEQNNVSKRVKIVKHNHRESCKRNLHHVLCSIHMKQTDYTRRLTNRSAQSIRLYNKTRGQHSAREFGVGIIKISHAT